MNNTAYNKCFNIVHDKWTNTISWVLGVTLILDFILPNPSIYYDVNIGIGIVALALFVIRAVYILITKKDQEAKPFEKPSPKVVLFDLVESLVFVAILFIVSGVREGIALVVMIILFAVIISAMIHMAIKMNKEKKKIV